MKANILIIDDDQSRLNYLETILSVLNQNIIKCTSSTVGLKALLENKIALILLDVNLLVNKNVETAKLIKTRLKTNNIPIIFLITNTTNELDATKDYSNGTVDYICSPINETYLLSKTRVFLDNYFLRTKEQLQTKELEELTNNFLIIDNKLLALNEKLAESENQFRFVFDLSCVGKSLTSPEGKILRVNKAFASMLGYSIEEMQSLNFMKVIHANDIAKSIEFLNNLLTTDQSTGRIINRYIKKDGNIIWADVSVTLFRDGANKPLYFITSILDVSEMKKAEFEIKQLNEELESFSYSAAHDLRAPLSGIEGVCELLRSKYHEQLGVQGLEYLGWIRISTKKMRLLIDDLLTLSRINKVEIQRETVDLSEIAKYISNELRSLSPERKAEFIIEEGITTKGDSVLLSVLLRNLIENAWKYSAKNELAKIEFRKTYQDNQLVYFVRDNGIGFDMKYAEKIFEAFQRLHGSSEYEGTGIGLATVQRIINRHGGGVWAEAELNKGATFYFKL